MQNDGIAVTLHYRIP